MTSSTRVVLIGGTSHVGKSTFAESLADALAWQYLSTDSLSRHPGRPWRLDGSAVPAHVIQYFQTRSTEVLLDEVLQHFRQNVWPIAEAIVQCRLANEYDIGLVLEGSAILPGCVHRAGWNDVKSLWFLDSNDLIRQRILAGSHYLEQPASIQRAVSGFLDRSLAFDHFLTESLAGLNFDVIDADNPEQIEHVKNAIVSANSFHFQKTS